MKTTTRTMLALTAVLLLVGVAGCVGGEGQAPDTSDSTDLTTNGTIVYDEVQTSDNVVRFIDREAGVVCYYYAHPSGYAGQGGLSCLPMNETSLGR